MSACSYRCGYCGACTAAWERDAPDDREDEPFDAAREAAEDRADLAQDAELADINAAIREGERQW